MRCCFIPPILLKQIATNGDADAREWALEALADTSHDRGARAASAGAAARTAVRRPRKLRTVFTAAGSRHLPGTVLRSEGEAKCKDVAADEAFDGAGKTYDFFHETLSRSSLDNEGLPLDSTVHYGRRYANAFWNGRQMVYGDGDGKYFGRFTAALEVIGHELTHGVTQYAAQLEYEGEAGALNEHFSDVFGVLVKQYALRQSARQADWLIGVGILSSKVKGSAVRSMSAPGTAYDDPILGRDMQPAHMKNYVETHEDNGGVHVNSGIPNKAFYELATALGGNAWEAPGRIWYATLCNRLEKNATFQQCADATSAVAAELFGRDSREQKAVRAAWRRVGITAALRTPKAVVPPEAPRLTPIKRTPSAASEPGIAVGEEAGVRPENFQDPEVN